MADLAAAPGVTPEFVDLIGKPFVWKARGPAAYDCYGLIEELARRAGLVVPDYHSPVVMEEVAQLLGRSVSQWEPCEPGPGAVATIRVPVGPKRIEAAHVGWLLPAGRFIHAWEATGVCVERVADWQRRITGFYRFPQA